MGTFGLSTGMAEVVAAELGRDAEGADVSAALLAGALLCFLALQVMQILLAQPAGPLVPSAGRIRAVLLLLLSCNTGGSCDQGLRHLPSSSPEACPLYRTIIDTDGMLQWETKQTMQINLPLRIVL